LERVVEIRLGLCGLGLRIYQYSVMSDVSFSRRGEEAAVCLL
jgi:hypothetical protein